MKQRTEIQTVEPVRIALQKNLDTNPKSPRTVCGAIKNLLPQDQVKKSIAQNKNNLNRKNVARTNILNLLDQDR
jgi:hypothetical protein